MIRKKKYSPYTPRTTAENKLNRDFYATVPNQKWLTDVTEFKISRGKGKLYLSMILNWYNRYLISYVINRWNDNRLVFRIFNKAIAANPDAKSVFHSDRGYQYTGKVFQGKLKKQQMDSSMSKVGHCIDNGSIEGFWSFIKSEMYQMYEIMDEASLKHAIRDYIRFIVRNACRTDTIAKHRSKCEMRLWH